MSGYQDSKCSACKYGNRIKHWHKEDGSFGAIGKRYYPYTDNKYTNNIVDNTETECSCILQ